MARPELHEEIERELAASQPGLRMVVRPSGVLLVLGSYGIPGVDPAHARYAIEMHIPPDYPDELPTIFEVGGRIPRTLERHVNTNGSACLMVPEEWLLLADDTSFTSFMAGPVKDFFVGQSLVELGQPWPNGERSHGVEGVREAYAEILGVADKASVESFLACLEKPLIKGHWPCPCGSGEVIRRCHRESVRGLQSKVTAKLAKRMLARLAAERR